jgi:hypothetical protein
MGRVLRHIQENNIQQLPTDIVHPEKFRVIASYNSIAFRPLARELPRQTFRKLTSLVMRKL